MSEKRKAQRKIADAKQRRKARRIINGIFIGLILLVVLTLALITFLYS